MLTAVLEAPVKATDPIFDELRAREFARLDRDGHAYLDYTGSALYGQSQLRAHEALLDARLYANPHSDSDPSRASTEAIESARRSVLRFFGVDASTHVAIFTANATAAMRLVAESYPFSPETTYVLSVDNHNSVNGIREYARRAGARIRLLPLDSDLRLRDPIALLEDAASGSGGLLAFPAQSNFSGVHHPLSLIDEARNLGLDVLLDAAAFVPSHVLDLRRCPADFVALSFYKLFGYPTGIGALVARRDALERLRRPWFSGGAVLYASVAADTHRLVDGPEAFEDGTPNFLAIPAIEAGFALIEEAGGMISIRDHVHRLTRAFLEAIRDLRHRNGMPLVTIYGPRDMTDRGGTVAFNLRDRDGAVLPFALVEDAACRAGISLRSGCFCNPGVSEVALGLEQERLSHCLDHLGASFTPARLSACADTAVGAVRASIGLANNLNDIQRAIDLIASFRE
jgi:selenocysteine lyase/cysteine desulfurase